MIAMVQLADPFYHVYIMSFFCFPCFHLHKTRDVHRFSTLQGVKSPEDRPFSVPPGTAESGPPVLPDDPMQLVDGVATASPFFCLEDETWILSDQIKKVSYKFSKYR